jgi:hypothetical protein
MSRNRAWRRYIEESTVIKRLKIKCSTDSWWRFEDINGIKKYHRRVIDYLGNKDYYRSKTTSTTKWDSRYKTKYSPNSTNGYYRDPKKFRESTGLREKDKRDFHKILRENGFK